MNEFRCVKEIARQACVYHRYEPDDKKKAAIEKKIRRVLREERHLSPPYRVGTDMATLVISADLADYFAKLRGEREDARQRREARERAVQRAAVAQEGWDDYVETQAKHMEIDNVLDFGILPAEFDRIMLRALFYHTFPHFDEERFRRDYEERAVLVDVELSHYPRPDISDYIDASVRYEALSEKLDPALSRGDISYYLPDQQEA